MSAKAPPIPPKNLSDKGSGENARLEDRERKAQNRKAPPDPDKQGQQANTKVNLTPQLSTQDR